MIFCGADIEETVLGLLIHKQTFMVLAKKRDCVIISLLPSNNKYCFRHSLEKLVVM